MSSQKTKGTAFEALVLSAVELYRPDAYRMVTAGAHDTGDIWVPDESYVVEAKHHTRLDLAGWWAQAEREAVNAGRPYGIVVHKRVRTARPLDQWVTTTLGHFLGLLYGEPEQGA